MTPLKTLGLVISLAVAMPVMAEWQADPGDKLQQKSAQAIAAFREHKQETARYFEEAYGLAIFPSVTRVGLGFGGAYGKGLVIEGDRADGTTRFKQLTGGIQAGFRNFSMIIFFKDKVALDDYRNGNLEFMGNATVAVATADVASSPAFNEGVAIITMTRFGLMGEFSYSGAKFSYRPFVAE